MEGHRSSVARLSSTILRVGAALAITALTVLSAPTLNESAIAHTSKVARAGQTRQSSRGRWIEVDISSQRLTAWNGKTRVRTFIVSTGKRGTPTRIGTFNVGTKHRSTRMRGRGYNIANVPYTMYYSGGYAIHGAYWHNRFGTRVSRGCVNLRVSQARWLYNWAPVGTRIVIHQ